MTRQRAASRTDLNYTRGAFATGRLGNSLEVGRVNQEMLAESTRQASVYVTGSPRRQLLLPERERHEADLNIA